MSFAEKYDKMITGVVAGFLLPFLVGLIIFLFSSGGLSPGDYLDRILKADIVTHAISICVFPNVFIFLIFNRFDMLVAARGVLAITIFWAILVFAEKLL
jgi:hypothetical protein